MALQVTYRVAEADKHSYDVNSLIYHKGFLYSGADDGKIMMWDDNLKKKGEVEAHPCSIYSLVANEDTIYSCSNDGTVKSFTLDLKPKETLIKEECEYWKLATSDGILYAGDDKGTITVFQDDKKVTTYELLEPVKDMIAVHLTLYTAKDTDTMITEITKGSKVTFANHMMFPGRAPICIIGNRLIVTERSAKGFLVLDNSTGGGFKEKAADAHEMIINSIVGCTDGDKILLYTAGWDKNIKQWNIMDNSCKNTGNCKIDLVINAMCMKGETMIFAGGSDGNIISVEIK